MAAQLPAHGDHLLVAYDPSWPQQFARAASELRRSGNPGWLVEHIGSTAVPGLAAKPVIDLAVRIEDADDLDQHRLGLEAAGWRLGSSVRTHPVMLRERDGRRTAIAHFFLRQDWETVHQRLFRDWLLDHPEDAREYEAVKYAAAAQVAGGGRGYSAAKAAAVQAVVDRARAERGLGPVPVSDK